MIGERGALVAEEIEAGAVCNAGGIEFLLRRSLCLVIGTFSDPDLSEVVPARPTKIAEKARIAEPARYGAWFGKLSEAIEDGIRCRMTYRSLEDDDAHERVIDPIAVTEEHGETYLIAWNVEKDAERRYRLDRIQDVTFTEDSIEQHGAQLMDTAASLRESGQHVRLAVPSLAYLQRLDWAGIGEIAEEPDGSATCTLFFNSKHWLFDQLLSAGGDIVLLDASELAGELAAYAEELLASVDR